MKKHRLLKTTSFRLSALYLLLILLSFTALGVGVYFLTERMLQEQLKDTLKAGLIQLQNTYKADGMPELSKEIEEKENIAGWNTPDYILIDPAGKKLAGSLVSHSYKQGFQIFAGPPEYDDPDEQEIIYADAVLLPGGYWLAVGEDGEYILDFGETIISAFAWGALIVFALGIPCGFYLSRSFLKKIEGLTRSTRTIIAGDLTHRLAVSRSGDELDDLAGLINHMLDQINALIENVRQVSNDIAHDLRMPISRLRQHLEDAQSASLSMDQYRVRIEFAIGEIDTILGTFSALLRIAQIESGTRRGGFKTIDLGILVADVVDAFLPVADEKGKIMDVRGEKNVTVSGDRELLIQLVFNLIENAIQHTPEGSRIGVALKIFSDRPELVIADNGPGIPLAFREKVFQRFFRVEQSRSAPGNGLGLSIVRAIAELHGAEIVLTDNMPGLKVSVLF